MTDKWQVCGTDDLKGAVIDYVHGNGDLSAHKGGYEYRTEATQDWGYCYCYDYGNSSCYCTPTMTVLTEKRKIDNG